MASARLRQGNSILSGVETFNTLNTVTDWSKSASLICFREATANSFLQWKPGWITYPRKIPGSEVGSNFICFLGFFRGPVQSSTLHPNGISGPSKSVPNLNFHGVAFPVPSCPIWCCVMHDAPMSGSIGPVSMVKSCLKQICTCSFQR